MAQTRRKRRKIQLKERATLADMTDRELMELILECEDPDGYVDTRSIVDVANVTHVRANTCVGSRMSWMARFGYIDKHKTKKGLWTVNKLGRRLVEVRPVSIGGSMEAGTWAATVAQLAQNSPSQRGARTFGRREWKHYMEKERKV